MSDTTTGIPIMYQCSYCGNWHMYSEEMCQDMHKPVQGMFSAIYAPCNECQYRKAAKKKTRRGKRP